jgi:hypothetical protein
MGAPLGAFSNIALKPDDNDRYIYTTTSLPKGHPDFVSYLLWITPQHGLCKVKAISHFIPTNVYGEQLKVEFERLRTGLSNKYGRGKDYDFLQPGSIWKEPRDFMVGLKKQERVLATMWAAPNKPLPDNLGSVGVEAHAVSDDKGAIIITYESKDVDACTKWIRTQRDSSL